MKFFSNTIILFFFCASLFFFWKYKSLKAEVDFAFQQVILFEDMIAKAKSEEERGEIVEYAEYVDNYYPSGSRISKGGGLDGIVEYCRQKAVFEIMSSCDEK